MAFNSNCALTDNQTSWNTSAELIQLFFESTGINATTDEMCSKTNTSLQLDGEVLQNNSSEQAEVTTTVAIMSQTMKPTVYTYSITFQQYKAALKVLVFYLYPMIQIVGSIGNVISCMILKRLGLEKPYNIVLFCVSLCSAVYLITQIDLYRMLCTLQDTSFILKVCLPRTKAHTYVFETCVRFFIVVTGDFGRVSCRHRLKQ